MAQNTVNIAKDGSNQAIPGQYYNPTTDRYEVQRGSGGAADVRFVEGSSQGAFAVTPNDSTDLSKVTKGLYIGVSGDVRMTMADGSVITRKNVAGGMTHPWSIRRVWATGTTATDIVGDY
ncbi:spike base protein, RCAP_Rcc01079 family [Paenibacillus urinalis]|uniref:spike base protein, RCAP_Rcc01079 family n=1 Tax=Paenibacillus urinalis TaxID=521520 RepID=UPI00196068D8